MAGTRSKGRKKRNKIENGKGALTRKGDLGGSEEEHQTKEYNDIIRKRQKYMT